MPPQGLNGDGTVPQLAATPIDQLRIRKTFRGVFLRRRHTPRCEAAAAVLADLIARLKYYQAPNLAPYRGATVTEQRGKLAVDLPEATPVGEPVAQLGTYG